MSKNSYFKNSAGLINTTAMLMLIALVTFSLAACSSDKDEPKDDEDGLVHGTLDTLGSFVLSDDPDDDIVIAGEITPNDLDEEYFNNIDYTNTPVTPAIPGTKEQILAYFEKMKAGAKGAFKSTSPSTSGNSVSPDVQFYQIMRRGSTAGWTKPTLDDHSLEVSQELGGYFAVVYRVAALHDFSNNRDYYLVDMRLEFDNNHFFTGVCGGAKEDSRKVKRSSVQTYGVHDLWMGSVEVENKLRKVNVDGSFADFTGGCGIQQSSPSTGGDRFSYYATIDFSINDSVNVGYYSKGIGKISKGFNYYGHTDYRWLPEWYGERSYKDNASVKWRWYVAEDYYPEYDEKSKKWTCPPDVSRLRGSKGDGGQAQYDNTTDGLGARFVYYVDNPGKDDVHCLELSSYKIAFWASTYDQGIGNNRMYHTNNTIKVDNVFRLKLNPPYRGD